MSVPTKTKLPRYHIIWNYQEEELHPTGKWVKFRDLKKYGYVSLEDHQKEIIRIRKALEGELLDGDLKSFSDIDDLFNIVFGVKE